MMAADEAVDEAGNASSEASAAQPEANAMDAAAYAAEASRTATGVLQELAHDPLDANTARFYGEALGRALANPPTYAQKVAQMRETEAHLKSTYGEANAAKMVADAMGEVEHLAATSLPKIREWLEESGGGNDPFLIARLAERAVARAKRQALKGIKR